MWKGDDLKKNKFKTRFQNQKDHSKKRAKERFDLLLNTAQLMSLAKLIHNKTPDEAVFVEKLKASSSGWFVKYHGKWYPVAYDPHRKSIQTFLPPGSLGPEPKS